MRTTLLCIGALAGGFVLGLYSVGSTADAMATKQEGVAPEGGDVLSSVLSSGALAIALIIIVPVALLVALQASGVLATAGDVAKAQMRAFSDGATAVAKTAAMGAL